MDSKSQRWSKRTPYFLAFLAIFFLLVSGCTTSPGRPSSSSPAGETDLSRLGGFDEPLIPVGPKPSQKENEMLAVALRKFRADKGPSLARFDDLESFLKAYPHSSWKPSLRLNLGIDYHRMGRYSLALTSLQEAWQLMRDSKEPRTRALADLALGQWSISLAHLGRYEELEPLLKEARTRSLTGPSVELVTAACEGLYNMNTDAAHAFLCGPAALSRICRASSFWNSKSQSLLRQARSTRKGTSLHQVARLSESLGMSYQMAYREPGNAALIKPQLTLVPFDSMLRTSTPHIAADGRTKSLKGSPAILRF